MPKKMILKIIDNCGTCPKYSPPDPATFHKGEAWTRGFCIECAKPVRDTTKTLNACPLPDAREDA